MVRRIRVKQLQAGLFTTVGLRLIEPGVTGLQNLPLMFHDLDDVDFIGDALHPMFEKKLEAKGFAYFSGRTLAGYAYSPSHPSEHPRK